MSHTTTWRSALKVVAIVSSAALTLSACGGSSGGDGDGKAGGKKLVYFMAPNTTPTRYIQQDGPDFKKAIEKLDSNVEVKFVNAGGSSATQL